MADPNPVHRICGGTNQPILPEVETLIYQIRKGTAFNAKALFTASKPMTVFSFPCLSHQKILLPQRVMPQNSPPKL